MKPEGERGRAGGGGGRRGEGNHYISMDRDVLTKGVFFPEFVWHGWGGSVSL